jgi:hypothetical protein
MTKTTDEIRNTAGNSTFAIGGVSCSADSLVVAENFVLRTNICAINPPLRQAAKRYRKPYFTTVQPQTDDFSTT